MPNIILNSSPLICKGESLSLTASGSQSYTGNTQPSNTSSVLTVSLLSTSSFTVLGLSVNGCTNTASRTVSVVACTSLEEQDATGSVLIFPNPNKGSFVLRGA